MMKLLKYEFRKTILAKLIVFGVALLAELVFVYGMLSRNYEVAGWTALILVLLASGGIMGIGIQSIVTLHRDMNTRQSYMLFMTPNSCYKILGAKYLECLISLLFAGAVFFLIGALDADMVLRMSNTVENFWTMMKSFIHMMNTELDISYLTMAALFLNLIAGWVLTVATAFLADVFAVSLLRGKKAAGITAFGMFAGIRVVTSFISLPFAVAMPIVTVIWVNTGISFVLSAVMYYLTALIMQKKLSV